VLAQTLPNASRSSKPSIAQAMLLPALAEAAKRKMANSKTGFSNFQGSNRQGERNPALQSTQS